MPSVAFNPLRFCARLAKKIGKGIAVTDYTQIDTIHQGDTLRSVVSVRVADVKSGKAKYLVYIGQDRQPVRGNTVSEAKMNWRYYSAKAGLVSTDRKPLPNVHAATSRITL